MGYEANSQEKKIDQGQHCAHQPEPGQNEARESDEQT